MFAPAVLPGTLSATRGSSENKTLTMTFCLDAKDVHMFGFDLFLIVFQIEFRWTKETHTRLHKLSKTIKRLPSKI